MIPNLFICTFHFKFGIFYLYSTGQKFGHITFMFLKEVSQAHLFDLFENTEKNPVIVKYHI